MKTIRNYLKDMTPEQAFSLLGYKTKHQIAKWLAHGQIPFTAADKILGVMFYEELSKGDQVPPQEVADERPTEEEGIADFMEQTQSTPEQIRIQQLEAELHVAKQAMNAPAPEPTPTRVTWADVSRAGASKPVTPGDVPGIIAVDPTEQSTRSMTLPGRVAVNLPPRPALKAEGPRKIEPTQPVQQVPVQPTAPRPVSPQNRIGWARGPAQPRQQAGWTKPHPPKPAKQP